MHNSIVRSHLLGKSPLARTTVKSLPLAVAGSGQVLEIGMRWDMDKVPVQRLVG